MGKMFPKQDDEEKKVTEEIKPNYKQSEKRNSDKVVIKFKKNRSFELHVGRHMLRFMPHEAKEVDREIIKHPDFQSVQEKYFTIIE